MTPESALSFHYREEASRVHRAGSWNRSHDKDKDGSPSAHDHHITAPFSTFFLPSNSPPSLLIKIALLIKINKCQEAITAEREADGRIVALWYCIEQ